jgi:HSP20 family molecular chaperone IbpA
MCPGAGLRGARMAPISEACGRFPARRVPHGVGLAGFTEVPDGASQTMTRYPSLSHPFLLGFDDIERALDRVAKSTNDGYPPYNIEKLNRSEHAPERLRITLAVAGFTRGQLDIRGRQVEDKERSYLHRGIAARQFQRTFLLADGMEVLGADLSNGLLSVDLARPEPERIVRKIDILARD